MYSTNRSQQWNTPPLDLQLQPDEVHVWRVPLVVPEPLFQQLSQLLSEQEITKAGLFRFMRDRRRWIIAHGFLRLLLSRYLLVDAGLLHFDVNAYGKPFLVSPVQSTSLQFNVSHSHELALYAFSYSRQVGIDVEYKRANVDYEGVARVSFSQDEQARLRSLPDELKQEAFYNCWARKEAYIKARGKGMSIDLAQFDVSFLPGEPA